MFTGLVQFLRSLATRPAAAVATVVAFTLPAAACGTATGANNPVPGVIVLHDNANGRTITLRAGDSLELVLSSSYWNVTGSSASRVLQQEGGSTLLPRPSTCPNIPGLGCTPERTNFKALTRGTAIITANRTSCGEALRCPSSATRFKLTVVVT